MTRLMPIGYVQGWLEGEGSKGDLTICDVRDVACAHIAAVEAPAASGRYIISDSHCISSKFVADTFKVGATRWCAAAIDDLNRLGFPT